MHSSNLYVDDVRCVGEFRTTFRTIPAFVAQWIEQRFPKPQVACSIHAGGAKWKWGIPTGTRCGHPRFGDSFGLWFTAAITLYRRSTWRRVTPALRVIPSDVFVFLSRELSSAGTRERCIVPVSDSNKSAINNVRTDNSRGRPDLGLWALIFSSITTANAELPDK